MRKARSISVCIPCPMPVANCRRPISPDARACRDLRTRACAEEGSRSARADGFLADKGIILLTWVWQAAASPAARAPSSAPEDAKGLKVRGGSREMDMVLQDPRARRAVGAFKTEIYAAMQPAHLRRRHQPLPPA